jgi:hypothetical protein
MFSLQQNQRIRGWNRFYLEEVLPRSGGKGEVAQTMYTHVSKCKSDKNFLNAEHERRIQ